MEKLVKSSLGSLAMEFSVVEVIGHLAFLLTAISFYLKDILLLRFLAIVSSLVGIGYNYFLPMGTLWLPIFWLGVFAMINGWRILGIMMDRHSICFNADEKELYETVFNNFSPVEFMKLMRVADWRHAKKNEVFAMEGCPVDGLRLLFSGEVSVQRAGKEISRVRDGALVGEMSFIQGGDASATVKTTVPCRYVYWSKEGLRGLFYRNPNIDVAMKHVFGLDLTRKLTSNSTETVRSPKLK